MQDTRPDLPELEAVESATASPPAGSAVPDVIVAVLVI